MPRSSKEEKGLQLFTQIPEEQISWDAQAFDDLLTGQGVTLVHFRAMRCPIGATDRNDVHHPNEDHEGCSNGFMYHKAGCVTAWFGNNPTRPLVLPEGMLESSSTLLTLPRHYDGTEEHVIVAPYDKFYLKDCELQVVTWEMVEAHSTGIDRTQYPVVAVEHLVDSRGITYACGVDFEIRAGKIVWLGQNRPGFDVRLGKGVVYSIRYRYIPHWFVQQLLHEIRVAQITDQVTFERHVERLPYGVALQREYVFLNADRDKEGKDVEAARSPESGGSLGPR